MRAGCLRSCRAFRFAGDEVRDGSVDLEPALGVRCPIPLRIPLLSVGGGLCPAPLGKGSVSHRFPLLRNAPVPRRGGPMCPPGHASSRDPFTGRHTGRPLRSRSKYPSTPEERAGTEPRPYRSIAVPSSGPMYLRHGFRRPNFVPKFGASVMGIGPYAPRGDEGRHAGSSCPTGGCGEPPRLPWVAAHSGAFAPEVARK